MCIAGAARGFSTPLLLNLLKRNLFHAIGVEPRLFFLLKSLDSPKTSGSGVMVHFDQHHETSVMSIQNSLRQSWIAPAVAEAVVLEGSGDVAPDVSGAPSSWSPDAPGRVVRTNDTMWRQYRSRRCERLWSGTNNEQRLIHNHLALQWCAAAIQREEARSGQRFDAVLFARPDLLWWEPLALPSFTSNCLWGLNSTFLRRSKSAGHDNAWVAPRAHLAHLFGQATLHHDCNDDPTTAANKFATCCLGSEQLLLYTLQTYGIPFLTIDMTYDYLRSTVDVCNFHLSSSSRIAAYFQGHAERCRRETTYL